MSFDDVTIPPDDPDTTDSDTDEAVEDDAPDHSGLGRAAADDSALNDTVSLASMEVIDGPRTGDEPHDLGGSGITAFAQSEGPRVESAPSEGVDAMHDTEAGDVMDASVMADEPAAPAVPAPDLTDMGIAPGSTGVYAASETAESAAAEPAAESRAPANEAASSAAIDRARVRQLVEGALFTAPGPLSAAKLAAVADGLAAADVRLAVEELNAAYRANGHAFLIEEIAGGFRMLTRKELGEPLGEFFAKRSKDRLSRAALETLAIIAYKQPVTRAAIETIRGVASDSVVANLIELGLVRISGQAEGPGRPILYSTTKRFLDHFGLRSLRDLPREKDFDAMEKA